MIIDNPDLPDEEISQWISDRCSEHGRVSGVDIYRATIAPNGSMEGAEDFAIVTMADADGASRLHGREGGKRSGNQIIVRLEWKGSPFRSS